ncbi:ead/Ea22-like family protein [Klebsiella quasipneumoniae]|uniref:ead/Ea22-like family protein n=1 Tax=Klebsiella quasipneumoniae TaxID=1463165 RepID=UPI003DA11509
MTTDITELALIDKIQKQLENFDTVVLKEDEANALVEALEKAKQRNGELETYSKTALEFREAARDENRHLKLELEIAEKRITELESRTVKLPQRLQPGADGYDDWYVHSDDDGEYLKFDDVLAMLTAAGIKVEAE